MTTFKEKVMSLIADYDLDEAFDLAWEWEGVIVPDDAPEPNYDADEEELLSKIFG